MKFKAIIFDMDGTIVETEHVWKEATRIVIQKRGVTITPELDEYLSHHLNGMALGQSCKIIKDLTKTDESIECLVNEKSATARALYADGIKFVSGFPEFHNAVMQANLKTGLATNADDPTLELTQKTLNLAQFFGQHMYGISKVNYVGKPHPAIYLHAAEQLMIDPKECIAIEDSTHGINAAKAAGMVCIGINTHGKRERLSNADVIIDGYHEINLPALLT